MNIRKLAKEKPKNKTEEIILDALRDYTDDVDKNWNYITAPELKKKGLNKFYILDIRKEKDFKEGHLPGAHNIFWLDLLDDKNLNTLPQDQTILLVCYVGHTTSQMMVVLKLLGYDVVALKFGMGKSPVEGVPVAGWLDYGFEVESENQKDFMTKTGAMPSNPVKTTIQYKDFIIKITKNIFKSMFKGAPSTFCLGVKYDVVSSHGASFSPSLALTSMPANPKEIIDLPRMWIDAGCPEGKNNGNSWTINSLKNRIEEIKRIRSEAFGDETKTKNFYDTGKDLSANKKVKITKISENNVNVGADLNSGMEQHPIDPTPEQEQALIADFKSNQKQMGTSTTMQEFMEILKSNPKLKGGLNHAIDRTKGVFPQLAQILRSPQWKQYYSYILKRMSESPKGKMRDLESVINELGKVRDKEPVLVQSPPIGPKK